jgi:hypothetical protein
MEEKTMKEMMSLLKEIKDKLSITYPVFPQTGHIPPPHFPPRPIDPSPEILLNKPILAQLKIHKINGAIAELQKQIDFLKFEQNLLKEEYKIK